MSSFWQEKQIIIGIGGGIAAYKTLSLIRLFQRQGARVTVVTTKAGLAFVTPTTLNALTLGKFYTDMFSLEKKIPMGHIQLAKKADLLLLAPATADMMARLATGQANDLPSAIYLACEKPVLAAPAMNCAMWNHPATQRNRVQLEKDGVSFVDPEAGDLACGDEGVGRLASEANILEAARRLLTKKRLNKKHLLITAGPTREYIDPIRYLSNRSSGKMGWAIAQAARRLGAEVSLIHGPVQLAQLPGVKHIPVESAQEMLKETLNIWNQGVDGAIFTAAVADFRSKQHFSKKMKKKYHQGEAQNEQLNLIANPDILATISKEEQIRRQNGEKKRLIIGFAAETDEAIQKAKVKIARKKCDFIVINDVSQKDIGFDADQNSVTILPFKGQVETWSKTSKEKIGEQLIDLFCQHI
ncbi:bifunctional phosphopantothenoylcysteine decarboxylase/phosphopantothenate--cysteine ligase CoaBC [Magnetococcales bacterium HHB-1]